MFKDKSKILFLSDMDGTLLNSDKTLSDINRSAMQRLRAAGGKFAVATGRVIQAARHYFKDMGFDCPVILSNGGMIYDCAEDKIKWTAYLPYEEAVSMTYELCGRFPQVCAEICTKELIYDYRVNDTERYHMKIGGFTAVDVPDLESIPSREWSKILFAMESPLVPAFAEYCKGLEHADAVEYVTSGDIFHEMLPKKCSKGDAMLRLLEVYGWQDCVTVAMGDFNNDITMLEYADFSACPSNAIDEVKAVSDMVCKTDCDGGAVAEVIDYILKQRSTISG